VSGGVGSISSKVCRGEYVNEPVGMLDFSWLSDFL